MKLHYFKHGDPGLCVYCSLSRAEGNHAPIPRPWYTALSTLATSVIGQPIPALLFRPIDITKATRFWASPLAGSNVVRGLVCAGLVEPVSQAPRPGRWGRTPVWYRVTPAGWAWLKTAPPVLPEGLRAPRAGGSVPL